MWSLSDCLPWMTVGLVESVAIVTLNLCTIIVFVRNHNLRKRSTLLVRNLAVIDMFVGGMVSFEFSYYPGIWCNLWKNHLSEFWSYFTRVLTEIFLFGSFINIAIIALERVHATFFPFRHRVLKRCIYGLIIGVVWVTSGLISIAYVFLLQATPIHASYLVLTVFSICLLIMCVSYTCIVIKFRCGAQPQHHGAASRERKLTMTLLIVTAVSLLLCLPIVVFLYSVYLSNFKILSAMSPSLVWHLRWALLVLFYANSLSNSILYAIRMPEYRSAFLALFRKLQQQRQDAVFPLREM